MIVSSRKVVGFALACALISGPVSVRASGEVRVLSLETGHSIQESAPGLRRIAVGNPAVIGVVPVATSGFVINAKGPGHTTIIAWDKNEQITYEVTVSDQNLDEVARLLRQAIGVSSVDVETFGQTLVVKGSVDNDETLAKVNDVLKRFNGVSFGAGPATVVNALTVSQPMGSLAAHLSDDSQTHGVHVENDANGNVIVTGDVHDRTTAESVLSQVRGMAGSYLKPDAKVIDRLNVATTSQIDIKVYVLEVDRTAASTLGIRLGSGTAAGIGEQPVLGTSSTLTFLENPTNNPLNVGPFTRLTSLAPSIDLMVSNGHSRLLSAPDLVALPGKTASFLVGGQIPIPVSNGLGSVAVQYQDYGVQLKVTPTLLGDGSIETLVNPNISDLDFGDAVTLNGSSVPALKTSSLSTDVITKDGESIVLGGLLRRVESKTIQKIPFLGDIPILGALFKDTTYMKQDSDVVFVMTPSVITR